MVASERWTILREDRLSEYDERATLYDGHRTRVTRAIAADGSRAVIKRLKASYPSPAELQRIEREQDLLGLLDGAGVSRILEVQAPNSGRLVTEDLGATALIQLLADGPLPAVRALTIAVNIARALSEVHAKGVLHRDVNPANIIVHPDTDEAWLIDFDLASPVPQRRARPKPMSQLEGTAAFMSPEQTGRMNRAVDVRSDLYSFGVTLFQLFSGRLPFEGRDVLAYAHAHLALEPPPLDPAETGLPPAVASVVATLMKKRPEDRYQSSAGLLADLEALLEVARGASMPELFGRLISDRLELPQELHGRQADREALLSDFESVRTGACAVALVSGAAGIGKTSLVHELHRPVTLAGGRLLEGKFDQFSRDTPYTALGQIFSALTADALAAKTAQVERTRHQLIDATAPNTALLLDLEPSIGVLVGPQPSVPLAPPAESARRLHQTVRRALGAVASQESPLVLFLDDLQWADLPSLAVIEALFRDPEMSHLMLVGSWRSEEVGPKHALLPTIEALRDSAASLRHLELGPLAKEDIGALLADALGRPTQELGQLAQEMHDKTRGNPFFLHRLVDQAWEGGAIEFDARTLRWSWDASALHDLAPADNVVALLRAELERLPEDARTCLAAAALMADSFGFDTLALATKLPALTIGKAMAAAVAGRLVHPLDEDWWSSSTADRPFRFAFVHDRVQQAARELLAPAELAQSHLALARGLRDSHAAASRPFEVAEHYCAARALVTDRDEQLRLVEIATVAGDRALSSAAPHQAQRFLRSALATAGPEYFETHPAEAAKLWRLAARAGWLVSDVNSLNRHVAMLRKHAKTPLDHILAEQVLISATAASGALTEALDKALEVLAPAGTTLPRHPNEADVMAAVHATMGALAGKDPDELIARRSDPDDAIEAAQRRLLIGITAAAYVSEPNLLPLIACNLVQRSVSHGVSRESSYGFAVFALTLCAGWALEAGTAQGRLAMRVQEAFDDRSTVGMTRHVVDNFARVWTEPLRAVYDANPEVGRALMDAGDIELAGWSMHQRPLYGVWCGVPLDVFSAEVASALHWMRLHEHQAAHTCTEPIGQLVANLRGVAGNPSRLDGRDYDAQATFDALLEVGFLAGALTVAIMRLTTRLFFWDLEGAAVVVPDVVRVQGGAVAIWYQVTWRAYAALVLLDQAEDKAAAIEQVLPWRDALAATAAHNPHNGAHLLSLFDAEVALARGDLAEAITRWDAAIDEAVAAGFTQDEAFISERVGRFHEARGARRIARAYLLDARFAWQRWDAHAKVAQLDKSFGSLMMPTAGKGLQPSHSLKSTQERLDHGRLDFESVLKAAAAIAQETELSRLLSTGLDILLENVGARRGALILVRRGELLVEAISQVGERTSLTNGTALGDHPELAEGVIRRVFRSGEPEVHDDYGPHEGSLSVLCAPVTHQGRPMGVLYFDNDLSAGTFTSSRVRVLDALAPQLAVAVRNARLQAAQDRFVPKQFLRSLNRTDIVDVQVGDHQLKEVSVFFSDIWGFTPLVEQLEAADALNLINRYLSFAEPAITGSGGFIDTYLGDGIMALFDEATRNPQRAVEAAIAFHRALDRFNDERRKAGLREVRTGVGINTGTVTMATIGGTASLKCGVVGDPVNLASRIEGLTRRWVCRVLISDETAQRVQDASHLHLRTAGLVRVRGRVTPLKVYEVLAAEPPEILAERLETLDTYEAALKAYQAGEPSEAVRGFANCLRRSPDDPQALRLLQASQSLRRDGVPTGWTGIENLRRK